ncbi:MAG: DUF1343 domain-containing protein [Bacteroidales bacterium]|nr:DUF1343 domain-containing protein [Bacteroidales bacterium]
MKRHFFAITLLFCVFLSQCHAQVSQNHNEPTSIITTEQEPFLAFVDKAHYISAAMQMDDYLTLLQGKRVGVVGNQTSIVGERHLVDTLLSLGIDIRKIYTPEHGFRGTADAGAKVNSGKDEKTGIAIASLYGKNKKPTPEMLQGIDIILFDLQDVGVRFYTYISTMSYVMEAAAENGIPVVVLDRPNPNGFYVDGPVLKPENHSFVGMHQVPVVYGMTIGEYALMVNGEGWLKNGIDCDLTVIPIKGYNRNAIYELPVKPSPNLPNWESVYLYPTLCFFEGSSVSVGRGTEMPFQVYGHPNMRGSYTFTPQSTSGASKPLLEGQRCRGENLVEFAHDYPHNESQLHLEWIIDAYQQMKDKGFFKDYFRLLAGDKQLQRDIENGKSADEIRASWSDDLASFLAIRQRYLLY